MKHLLIIVVVANSLALPSHPKNELSADFNNYNIDDEATMTAPELIEKYGYPVETHQVVTEDGFILTLHRIPHGKSGNSNGKVLFLQHGLLSSSADWIITGPEKGLAYIMADQGYDVWMGNARGNRYSRNNTHFDPDKNSEFWHFSWNEIGEIDLPTMIDYVLESTGVDGVYYAGHSQGTTSFYIMCASRPEYNDKIKVHVSLAPIAFMTHITSPLMRIIAFWEAPLSMLLDLIGVNEFLPSNAFLAMLGDVICKDGSITQILCTNSLFAICGFSGAEMNATILPVLMGHTPAGSSTRQFIHYAQEINSGHFRKFDLGFVDNMNVYGSLSPPDYPLAKITAPIYFIYSDNDWLSSVEDVHYFCGKIGNCLGKFLVADNNFNHLDYMYGIRAPELVYNRVISLMSRH